MTNQPHKNNKYNYLKLLIVIPVFFMILQIITLIISRRVFTLLGSIFCSDCKYNKTSQYLHISAIPILILIFINLIQVIYKNTYGFKGIYSKISYIIIILSIIFSITYNIILYKNIKSINETNCSCIQLIKKEFDFLKKYK